MKYYHLIARNVKTGKTSNLTRHPMRHDECDTMKSKFSENKSRVIELLDATHLIDAARKITADGFRWVYEEKGAHFYQKETATGYLLMRCLLSDLTPANFELMAKHGLTNTNRA